MNISSIGQDSHRFTLPPQGVLRLGGLDIPGCEQLEGNSDADVLLHALCNAISNVTGEAILGAKADELCAAGERNSAFYLQYGLDCLAKAGFKLCRVCFSIEAARPKLLPHIPALRENIARLCCLPASACALTATTGEGLTDCGRGLGMAAICMITVEKPEDA